jgi:hypothetical protein
VTACAFRFLRQPSRPKPPMPVAKSGSAAGSGVAAGEIVPETLSKVSLPPTENVPAVILLPVKPFSVAVNSRLHIWLVGSQFGSMKGKKGTAAKISDKLSLLPSLSCTSHPGVIRYPLLRRYGRKIVRETLNCNICGGNGAAYSTVSGTLTSSPPPIPFPPPPTQIPFSGTQ